MIVAPTSPIDNTTDSPAAEEIAGSSSGCRENATSRPSPITTDGTAIGR